MLRPDLRISGEGVTPDTNLTSTPCSNLEGGNCTTETCCSKTCADFAGCGAKVLAGTPASIVCGSAGDDCGDLSWTQCFDQFCVKRMLPVTFV